jgi:prophage regulatory protein
LQSTTATTVEVIDPFLRLPAVLAATGLTERTLYRKVAAGAFPSPKQLGPNSVGWRQSAVKEWNDTRPDSRAPAVQKAA